MEPIIILPDIVSFFSVRIVVSWKKFRQKGNRINICTYLELPTCYIAPPGTFVNAHRIPFTDALHPRKGAENAKGYFHVRPAYTSQVSRM